MLDGRLGWAAAVAILAAVSERTKASGGTDTTNRDRELVKLAHVRQARNAPCHCRSGRKFKVCCGKPAPPPELPCWPHNDPEPAAWFLAMRTGRERLDGDLTLVVADSGEVPTFQSYADVVLFARQFPSRGRLVAVAIGAADWQRFQADRDWVPGDEMGTVEQAKRESMGR